MSSKTDVREQAPAVAGAADELAGRLKALAETLGAQRQPTRIPYGGGRLGPWIQRRSPSGFVLDPVERQVLLPDGRLWSYSRNDAGRFPDGRFYDARADHGEFACSRIFPGGAEFIFLGAVLGTYAFGFAPHVVARIPGASGLCALRGSGRSVRYVDPAVAFAAIAESAGASPAGSAPGRGRLAS